MKSSTTPTSPKPSARALSRASWKSPELVKKESATELLLEAKGFTDVVVNLTGETADIVVPMKEVTEEQRAQIEDIVTRKTGIGVENIVIAHKPPPTQPQRRVLSKF